MSENPINEKVDHLFRRYAGRMVSLLTGKFGLQNIDIIEDAVQDALVVALKKWPFTGVPENEFAWLTQVAKNRVIDRLRRDARSERVEEDPSDDKFQVDSSPNAKFENELTEDQLRMMFACCHPSLSPDSQVALTLKIVSGFSVDEIARAYLAQPDAVAKMLTRAKQRLKLERQAFRVPDPRELPDRLDAVIQVLYLMFNEGYSATSGDTLIKDDLCFEAIRLSELLSGHPKTEGATVDAVLALFLFQASRLGTRVGEGGELLLLSEQDRSRWDRKLIARGLRHLQRSAGGDRLTRFHLEAEIAGIHSIAAGVDAVDWARILECYDTLQSFGFSPVVELNRIVAIEKVRGATSALSAVESLISEYGAANELFLITLAYCRAAAGDPKGAAEAYDEALGHRPNAAVASFIERRLRDLSNSHAV